MSTYRKNNLRVVCRKVRQARLSGLYPYELTVRYSRLPETGGGAASLCGTELSDTKSTSSFAELLRVP